MNFWKKSELSWKIYELNWQNCELDREEIRTMKSKTYSDQQKASFVNSLTKLALRFNNSKILEPDNFETELEVYGGKAKIEKMIFELKEALKTFESLATNNKKSETENMIRLRPNYANEQKQFYFKEINFMLDNYGVRNILRVTGIGSSTYQRLRSKDDTMRLETVEKLYESINENKEVLKQNIA